MSIHSRNDAVILEFGLHKPAFRICVNTPTTHGSIGLTTGLDPAMTLGCGGFGGNITSDNITPRHLLNIKRLAYELRPRPRPRAPAPPARGPRPSPARRPRCRRAALPRAAPPTRCAVAERLADGIDRWLGDPRRPGAARRRGRRRPPAPPRRRPSSARTTCGAPRTTGRRCVVGPRTIVTPAARDAGAAGDVLVVARRIAALTGATLRQLQASACVLAR